MPRDFPAAVLAWQLDRAVEDDSRHLVDCVCHNHRFSIILRAVVAQQRLGAPDRRRLLAVKGGFLRFVESQQEQLSAQLKDVYQILAATANARLQGTYTGTLDRLLQAPFNLDLRLCQSPPPFDNIPDLPAILQLAPCDPYTRRSKRAGPSPAEDAAATFATLLDPERHREILPLPTPVGVNKVGQRVRSWGPALLPEQLGLSIDMATRLLWASGGGGSGLDERPVAYIDLADGLLKVDEGEALGEMQDIVVSTDAVAHYRQGQADSTLSAVAAWAEAVVPYAIALTLEVAYLSTAWVNLVLIGHGKHYGLLQTVFERPGGRVTLLVASHAGRQALLRVREADEILLERFGGRRVLSYYIVDAPGPVLVHSKAFFGVGVKDGRHLIFRYEGSANASGRGSGLGSLQRTGRNRTGVSDETLTIEMVPLRSRAGHDILSEIDARFSHLAAAGRLILDRYGLHEEAEWDEDAKAFRATSRAATSTAFRTFAAAVKRKDEQRRRRLEGLDVPLVPAKSLAAAHHLRPRLMTDKDREDLDALSPRRPSGARPRTSSDPPAYDRRMQPSERNVRDAEDKLDRQSGDFELNDVPVLASKDTPAASRKPTAKSAVEGDFHLPAPEPSTVATRSSSVERVKTVAGLSPRPQWGAPVANSSTLRWVYYYCLYCAKVTAFRRGSEALDGSMSYTHRPYEVGSERCEWDANRWTSTWRRTVFGAWPVMRESDIGRFRAVHSDAHNGSVLRYALSIVAASLRPYECISGENLRRQVLQVLDSDDYAARHPGRQGLQARLASASKDAYVIINLGKVYDLDETYLKPAGRGFWQLDLSKPAPPFPPPRCGTEWASES